MTTSAPPDTPAPDIVLIHGANGCRAEMQPWAQAIAEHGFNVHTINLAGHGGQEIPAELSMKVFGDEVLAQLDRLQLTRPILMGYSFGGLVALHVASHHPGRAGGVVCLATKYIFDEPAVQHFTHLLQVPRLEGLPHRREHLQRVHAPNDWRKLVEALHRFFALLGTQAPLEDAAIRAVQCPALVLSGDSDTLVSMPETLALYRLLPRAQVGIFNGKAHPAEVVPTLGLAQTIKDWHKGLAAASA